MLSGTVFSMIVSSLYGLCFIFLPQHHKSPKKTKPFKTFGHQASIWKSKQRNIPHVGKSISELAFYSDLVGAKINNIKITLEKEGTAYSLVCALENKYLVLLDILQMHIIGTAHYNNRHGYTHILGRHPQARFLLPGAQELPSPIIHFQCRNIETCS